MRRWAWTTGRAWGEVTQEFRSPRNDLGRGSRVQSPAVPTGEATSTGRTQNVRRRWRFGGSLSVIRAEEASRKFSK